MKRSCLLNPRSRPAAPEYIDCSMAVVDHALGLALLQRHVERREHQFGSHLLADGPAHDAPAPYTSTMARKMKPAQVGT